MSELTLDTKIINAKRDFKPVFKNTVNGFLNKKYADLATVIDAIEDGLFKHGLDYYQSVEGEERITLVPATEKSAAYVIVSGKSIVTVITDGKDKRFSYYPFVSVVTADKPEQSLGKAHTYDRRYGLLAAFGLKAEDNDGEGGNKTGYTGNKQKSSEPAKPATSGKPAEVKTTPKTTKTLEEIRTTEGITVTENDDVVTVSGKTFSFSNDLRGLGFAWDGKTKTWNKSKSLAA